MKKNITINLYGTLYAIDEDACTLLEQYLDNMRSYFSQRDGGDEIADDIEHRVAELFSQLKEEGCQAISIEHVQDIITRIGNPEQMDDEADEDAHATSHDDTTTNASNDHTNASGSTESTDGAVPPPPPGQGDMQHINHGLVVASYIVTHKTRCWEVLFRDFANILEVQIPCLGAYLP